MTANSEKTIVFLLNLGGPDSPQAVKPFLFNLFHDRAIINLPQPFRFLLARFIAYCRTPKAQLIYKHLGGKSPILENTQAQAQALQNMLGEAFVVEPVMRYWHPRAQECVKKIQPYTIKQIVILPLYPQYSTTTSESSYLELKKYLDKQGLGDKISFICCYPVNEGWIRALQNLVQTAIASLPSHPYRVIFTAHGLPEKVIERGDPYQYHVEMTAKKIVHGLHQPTLDWSLAYQSRVGPFKWIGPSTEEEILRAGSEKRGVIVVPIAFVSEHSETLVELDIDYKKLAEGCGVPFYKRVPTVSTHPLFIEGLAQIVQQNLQTSTCLKVCGDKFKKCGARFG